MRFRECSKNEQAWIIFGGVLVALGLLLLLSGYTTWWTRIFVWLRQASRLVVPLSLIAIGAYVVWASRNNKFDNLGRMHTGAQGHAVLKRSIDDVRVAGVCGGIAQYFGIESTIVRVIAVLLGFASPLLMLLTYGILVLVLQKS